MEFCRHVISPKAAASRKITADVSTDDASSVSHHDPALADASNWQRNSCAELPPFPKSSKSLADAGMERFFSSLSTKPQRL
ncbi:hypothetical protein AMELA_G00043590 [Ameiurus melas]|uniref:Uncharacterized protein n=1 Tax=Ameiurus melas TaxID=219545 RepID=A0A7J6B485_AMEME|nr:hypothetical protein AMELA_G00043590 [Ameiurus melas]